MIIGLLGDSHGNAEAYEQGVAVLRAAGAARIYFLGDAVGYIPGRSAVEAVRTSGATPICGNHDAMVLSGQIDPTKDGIYRHEQTAKLLSSDDRAFMAGWPLQLEVSTAAGPLLLVHGSPSDPLHGYVYPDTDLNLFERVDHPFVFMAQTHRPFVRSGGRTLFVNVGSVGLPRDSGELGAACLFDDEEGEATIVRFDITSATATALARCDGVAPEVLATFARRSPDVIGR